MNHENDIGTLKAEIERIHQLLIRSQQNFDKKEKNLNFQLIALEKAVEIIKKDT
jgi:hypothetical protein